MKYESQLALHNVTATVLFQNKHYSIEQYTNPITGKQSLVVVRESTWTDFVMVYSPGRVAYDAPELLPKYIKDKVVKYSLTLNPTL